MTNKNSGVSTDDALRAMRRITGRRVEGDRAADASALDGRTQERVRALTQLLGRDSRARGRGHEDPMDDFSIMRWWLLQQEHEAIQDALEAGETWETLAGSLSLGSANAAKEHAQLLECVFGPEEASHGTD
ncbi:MULTISPECIES: hypothetical protein [unclassified Streptomyces]|uniref:hypothetical protein n=1 Tax=unclassified Streptomyces TaxID=2593676 RepID=UPI003811BDDB